MKRRVAAGFLAVVLSFSVSVTTLAAEVPQVQAETEVIAEETADEELQDSEETGQEVTPEERETDASEDGTNETAEAEVETSPEESVSEEDAQYQGGIDVIASEDESEAAETEETTEANKEAKEEKVSDTWTAEDFTYTDMSQILYGCDYTREFTVEGRAVAGFSESGQEKIKTNKDLVIPSKDTEGNTLVGVAEGAFKGQGIKTLRLPEGMMVDYDDTVTHVVTRRGNFLIGASAFDGNELTSLVLPEGVIFIGSYAFANNNLTYVKIPHTFWWIETMSFANNNLSTVDFPQTCDFQGEIHGMAFAKNNIKSVRLPDFMMVVNKQTFVFNPGMEECPEEAPDKEQKMGGVVYMYTDNPDLFNKERIHHIDRTAESQHSWHQKLILGDDPNKQGAWNVEDFEIKGTTITGLSESGEAKRKENKNLEFPHKNANGEYITEIGQATGSYGTFGAEGEGFDTVTLPVRLEKIGNNAFAENSIKSIEFPNTLKEIGIGAFRSNKLSAITLPDSVTTLGGGAFATNPNIEKVHLSKGLKEIPDGAFGCSDAKNYMPKWTEISIPANITTIGKNAFAGNNFHEIVIPSSVKSIGDYAFSTKEYLNDEATLTLNEGLETIGQRAFRNKVIKEVALPTTVKELPDKVFEKEYTSGEEGVKTKVYVTTEKQYNDKENFPKSDYHRLVLRLPGYEDQWNAEDFTYGTIEQEMYPAHDMEDKVIVKGVGITGLSESGEEKVEVNPDLVIPAEDYDGNTIVGIGQSALQKKGFTSVTFPEGVMADYKGGAIAEGLTQRGNFVIQSSAFMGNKLTKVDLPEGVIYVGNNAFKSNDLTHVSMSHTIWHIANAAFGQNEIVSVDFPETCDFKLNLDSMAFAVNKIQAVRLPDRTEKAANNVFLQNTGMEPVSDDAPNASYKKGGVVYMYNENVSLVKEESLICHTEGTGGAQSWVQKFIYGEMEEELQPWNASHFTFDGGTITGFSEAGKKKLESGDTEVKLPEKSDKGETVTAIGKSAFNGTSMTKVEIPDTVTSIGLAAFGLTKLTEVTIPDSVTELGQGAFTQVSDLTKVVLSKNLTEIPQAAFSAANKLTEIEIPKGVKSIGRQAFGDAPFISLELPEGLETIEQRAFMGNQIKELEIPASVKTIEKSAFSQIQDGKKAVLEKLTLNEGLEELASQAFGGANLKIVNIPSSLKKLAKDVFKDGNNGKVTLFTANKEHLNATKDFVPSSDSHVVVYDQMIGSGWTHDDFTYDGSTITGWSEKGNKTRLENHELILPSVNPDTLKPITGIGDGAFRIPDDEWEQGKNGVESPNGMESVQIPDTVTAIGANAFQYNNLTNVDFPASVTTIKSSAFNSNKLKKVILPDTVKEVEEGAFATNEITEIKISKGMTKLASGIFSMNIRLTHVEIPDGITEIGETAFAGARLETLEIPKSVTKIGRKAFHLHHLTELTIPGNVKEIGESAFEGTYKAITLKKLVLEEGIESIGKYAFKEGYIETVELPNSLKSLAKDAFYANAGTDNDHVVKLYTSNPDHMKWEMDETCQKLIFKASWTSDCFTYAGTTITGFSEKGLSYLEYTKEVVLPDKNPDGEWITAISAGAFKGYGLAKVTMPAKLESIGEEAFIDNKLEKAELPKTATDVADNAFDENVKVDISKEDPDDDKKPGEEGKDPGKDNNGGSEGGNDANGGNGSGSGSDGGSGEGVSADGSNGGSGSGQSGTSAARTGDTAPIVPVGAAMMLSLGAAIAVVIKKRSNKNA